MQRELLKGLQQTTISYDVTAHENQQLLPNNNNKTQLINMLIPELRLDGHDVFQSDGDADNMIVQKAL